MSITTTSYGTWANHNGTYASVGDAITGVLIEHDYAGDFDVEAITDDYRAAINAALPDGVTLNGDLFHGPYYPADKTWDDELDDADGNLNIKAIIDSVDLWPIILKHDITAQPHLWPDPLPTTPEEIAPLVGVDQARTQLPEPSVLWTRLAAQIGEKEALPLWTAAVRLLHLHSPGDGAK